MTAYRFRFTYTPASESLSRDLVVGESRSVVALQSTLNQSVGLDDYHLWFVGADRAFWESSVKYQRPEEFDDMTEPAMMGEEATYDASETTIAQMVDRLDLADGVEFCYLYDYGDEWRFSGTLVARLDGEPDDSPAEVVASEGGQLEQYTQATIEEASLPDPLASVFSGGPVPVEELRDFETHDDVGVVLRLFTEETDGGPVVERVAVQFDGAGYLLEHFPYGWELIERVEGAGRSEEERLAALATATRDWHAEMAELAAVSGGGPFAGRSVQTMNETLAAELDRQGYTDL